MYVEERMRTSLILVGPTDSVRAALGLLREHRIRHLPVVEQGRLVGIITDQDIRLAFPSGVVGQRDPGPHDALEKISVGDIMTRRVSEVLNNPAPTPPPPQPERYRYR